MRTLKEIAGSYQVLLTADCRGPGKRRHLFGIVTIEEGGVATLTFEVDRNGTRTEYPTLAEACRAYKERL